MTSSLASTSRPHSGAVVALDIGGTGSRGVAILPGGSRVEVAGSGVAVGTRGIPVIDLVRALTSELRDAARPLTGARDLTADARVVCLGMSGGDEAADSTVFDLASLTKVYVAVMIHQLADLRVLDLDRAVRTQAPGLADAPWAVATPAQLLSHRAGLPAESSAWRRRDLSPTERMAHLMSVKPDYPPGAGHRYSCVGYVVLGAFAEHVAGRPLESLIQTHVAAPLGASSLRFGPVDPWRTAATEIQPHRGSHALRGVVHDELAHSLGTPVGNAGLFGTVGDVLALGRALRARGEDLPGRSPLSTRMRERMATAITSETRGGHGQGLQVDAPRYMGASTSASRVGHTGFTGTSLVVERLTGTIAVLLSNRVHPRRTDAAAIDDVRSRVADVAFLQEGTM